MLAKGTLVMIEKMIGNRLNPEYVKDYINGIEGNGCTLLSEYEHHSIPLKIRCRCGNIFTATIKYFKNYLKCCHDCAMKHFTETRTKYTTEYVREILLKKGYILLSEKYESSEIAMDIECVDTGYRLRCYTNNIDKVKREPDFSGVHMLHNMKIWLKNKNIDYEVIEVETIKGYEASIFTFRCNYCGGIFITDSTALKEGRRCRCGKPISSGENRIKYFLEKNNFQFIPQHTFPDCIDKDKLVFDFLVYGIKDKDSFFIIEYDGKQHFYFNKYFHRDLEGFERSKLRDRIKTDYCLSNNIKLLRIPYWDFDRIESILEKYIYEFNL